MLKMESPLYQEIRRLENHLIISIRSCSKIKGIKGLMKISRSLTCKIVTWVKLKSNYEKVSVDLKMMKL